MPDEPIELVYATIDRSDRLNDVYRSWDAAVVDLGGLDYNFSYYWSVKPEYRRWNCAQGEVYECRLKP